MDRKYNSLLEQYEPVKIGIMGWSGPDSKNGIPMPLKMALDEYLENGILPRRYELIYHPENGLPKGSAKNAIDGFKKLVDDEGCIAVLGAHSSDNAIAVAPYANELKTPLISWAGTERLYGEYCFRLGNGDCGGDTALICQWLQKNNYKTIAVLDEISPNGKEYFSFLQTHCRRYGIDIVAIQTVSQTPDNLTENMERLKAANADALVYSGYGMLLAQGLVRKALDDLNWDPPRIMTTAFMYYIVGYDQFEGWVGIDQNCSENHRVASWQKRYVKRYKDDLGHTLEDTSWCNGLHSLAYDSGVVLAEAISRAPVFTGTGIKDGLERIRWVPALTGGPHTHISAAPYEHNLFSGDWLVYGKIENKKLIYQGSFDPCEEFD